MAIDRTTVLSEPGLLVFGSQHIYSKEAITVELIEETQPVPTDAFGDLDERGVDRRIEIKLTPVGELEALAVLYPHGGLDLGASPFGSTDAAAVIYTASGKSLTIHNAAVTTMPDLALGHKVTLFGEVTLTGLLRNEYDPNDANAYFTWAASGASYPGDASFSPAAIKTLGYVAAWGATAPWDEFYSEAGFSVKFNTSFESVPADGHGTIDMRLSNLVVEVTGTPVGIAFADAVAKFGYQGSGFQLGASKAASDDLVITNQVGATALHFALASPILKQAPARFGSKVRGVGELMWRATRTLTAGAADPLFTVGTSAP